VDVFTFGLAVPGDRLAALERLLSADERVRAARFRYSTHRNRYVAARGTLRTVLSMHTGQGAAHLRFRYGPNGKPELATPSPFTFNLAHAEDVAVLAVGHVGAIGVDVESCSAFSELDELASRYFSPAENAAYESLTAEDRSLAFFLGWTRKEAFIKGTGEGLSRPLDSFDVELRPGHPATLVRVPAACASGAWHLLHLEPAPGYVGALATWHDDGAAGSPKMVCWSVVP
jgi:4'-phosphopantetheinyl transferase